MASTDIAPYCNWETILSGTSDHLPIKITLYKDGTRAVPKPHRRRWLYNKANWVNFSNQADSIVRSQPHRFSEWTTIQDSLLQIAKQNIPCLAGNSQATNGNTCTPPWWTIALQRKQRQVNCLRRLTITHPSVHHQIVYKRERARLRRLIRRTKQDSWQYYFNGIGRSTTQDSVWKKIHWFTRNKTSTSKIPAIETGDSYTTTASEAADTLIKYYADKYYISHLSRDQTIETELPSSNSLNVSDYNCTYTWEEFMRSWRSLKATAPGKDDVSNKILQHLPESALKLLLVFFNNCWSTKNYPATWNDAIILPFLKPGKNPMKPESYRPITLQFCLKKLFDKMVETRCRHLFEFHKNLSTTQTGFRQGKSGLEHPLRIKEAAEKALNSQSIAGAVFLDIQDAFGSVRSDKLLVKLRNAGYSGNLIQWISNVLSPRSVQCLVQDYFSTSVLFNTGLPQGNPLSPLLFNFAVDGVCSGLPNDINHGEHADDIAIWTTSTTFPSLQRKLQDALNLVAYNLENMAFGLQYNKCKYLLFTRKKRRPGDFTLHIDGNVLVEAPDYKYLGIWFDSRLTWNSHIEKTVTDVKRRLNILKAITGAKWGASRSALKTIYLQYIRAKMEYGSLIFSSASTTSLKYLQTLQNTALRIILGVPKSTPINEMHRCCAILPLENRFQEKELLLAKIKTCTYALNLTEIPFKTLPVLHRQPLLDRLRQLSSVLDLTRWDPPSTNILELPSPDCAPWKNGGAAKHIIEKWLPASKRTYTNAELQQLFYSALGRIVQSPNTISVYTDASRCQTNSITGVGVAIPTLGIESAISVKPGHEISRLELLAIYLGLQHLIQIGALEAILCTDSKSALSKIKTTTDEDPLGKAILKCLTEFSSISLIWCPSHCGILGNIHADRLAGIATQKRHVDVWLPFTKTTLRRIYLTDFKRNYIQQWAAQNNPSIAQEYLTYRDPVISSCLPRRSEVLLNLFLCRRFPTNSLRHRFNQSHSPECASCQVQETIEHIMFECPQLASPRIDLLKSLNSSRRQTPTREAIILEIYKENRAFICNLFHLLATYCKLYRTVVYNA